MSLASSPAGLLARLLFVAVLALGAAPASAAVSDWTAGAKARVRLIAAGIGEDGRLAAGIEIRLPPGWKTYWRTPGDAGIAPTIDLGASRNFEAPDVRFPVPHRFDDGYAVTNVYSERVLLPVSAVVPDPTRSVFLVLRIELGVCEVICIPDRVDARLIVPPREDDPVAAGLLADAAADLPGPPEPGVLAVDDVTHDGGTDKRPVFRFAVTVDDPQEAVVFVEGPDDWRPAVPRFAGETVLGAFYTVQFRRLAAHTPIDQAAFRVTIVSGDRAVEQTIGLDD